MVDKKNILAVIPARSGSKGLKDKNIKNLCGKPMIAYTIEAAVRSNLFDRIHLSTDSDIYAQIGREYGADIPFLRSDELASDTSDSWDVVRSVIDQYSNNNEHYDIVTLLQPTSPLRDEIDIQKAFDIYRKNDADTVISLCESTHSPLWMNTLPENGCLKGFIKRNNIARRQDLNKYYLVNGAIYIADINKIINNENLYSDASFAYIMEKAKSIDIDDKLDFLIAETIMQSRVT